MDAEIIIQQNELKPTLAEYITNLYTEDGENGLYYHDGVGSYTNADQEAGDNSYRYAGADPNNYVCFGSDEATCPADNLYRIIGVFGDQVKLIKHDYAGESTLGTAQHGSRTPNSTYYKGSLSSIPYYYWSGSSSNSNTWSSITLNTSVLNGTYLDVLGSTWASKIANHTWQVGGNTYANITQSATPKTAYTNEITSPAEATTYNAKIGLMYVSDYGFASGPENWTTALTIYNNSTNTDNNWLYLDSIEWTISRRSDYANYAFFVSNTGRVDNGHVYSSSGVLNVLGIRPSFSLASTVEITSGTGTSTDPFILQTN